MLTTTKAPNVMMGIILAVLMLFTCLLDSPAATNTWDDGAADDNWSSGENWTNTIGGSDNIAPTNGDSVVLTATTQSFLDYDWTIQSGRSLTSLTSGSADDMGITPGASLTLATGGVVDIGLLRPRSPGVRDFLIEPGASLDTDVYGSGFQMDITFIASATGVTTWKNSGLYQIVADTLTIDLSSYDTTNGSTLVLMEYGSLSGAFASTRLLGNVYGAFDYAHNLGGGDLGIALTDIEPLVIWDNSGSGANFAHSTNWVGDVAPVSGTDSVLLDVSAGAAVLSTTFAIGSGDILMTQNASTGDVALAIVGGNLAVSSGGSLELLARSQQGGLVHDSIAGGTLAIEPGAMARVYDYDNGGGPSTNRFVANAVGVTTLTIENSFVLSAGLSVLDVDLTSYDPSTCKAIVLFDYGVLEGDGSFGSVVLPAGWSADVDYAYDQGGGDLAIALTNVTRTLTWTKGADSAFSTAGNWDINLAPVSGADSVILNGDIGGASRGEAFLTTEFAIGPCQSMSTMATGTTEDLKLNTGGHLTLRSGGTLNIGQLVRANTTAANMRFTLEADATADVYRYRAGEDTTTEFVANSNGVTTLRVVENVELDWGQPGNGEDTLEVDLSRYDPANGDTFVLIDYDGTLSGTFSNVVLSPGWQADVDYAYDQGASNVAVAITNIIPPIVWDDGGGDDLWSTAANWDPTRAPTNGETVLLTATPQTVLDYAWTIEKGQALTSTTADFGDELVLQSNAVLRLSSEGAMDIGFMRPRFSDGGQFFVEPGARLDTDNYGLNTTSATITFIADAHGVTTWNNAGQFQIGLDHLFVDLGAYDYTNGDALVLVDYDGLLTGEFASVTVLGVRTVEIDYAYDQGGGDLAIALTNITPIEGLLFTVH